MNPEAANPVELHYDTLTAIAESNLDLELVEDAKDVLAEVEDGQGGVPP